MTIGLKRVGIGALVLALALLAGLLRPGMPQESSEAAFQTPGGISAMPSALPGLPPRLAQAAVPPAVPVAAFGGMNQVIPAISAASGPGSLAVVTVICDDADPVLAGINCPDVALGLNDNVYNIDFEITKVFPDNEPLGATFVASGGTTLKCADGTTCDDADDNAFATPNAFEADGWVAVQVTGGGVNEVVRVTATDESGASRNVTIIFVETIFAVQPINSGTAMTSTIVSYRCPDVGAIAFDLDRNADTVIDPAHPTAGESDWRMLLEDVYQYFDMDVVAPGMQGPIFMSKATTQLYGCGGDTPMNPVDDRVNFETNAGILSVDEFADTAVGTSLGMNPPVRWPVILNALPAPLNAGSLDTSCDVGDSVDALDSPATLAGAASQLCDLDYAPNGVVSYGLLGTGDVGVAEVTAQQSGGGGVLRTTFITFAGAAAKSLFIQDAPASVGSAGADFNVAIIDQDGRPIVGETVECSVDPVGGALIIMPQTGTSNAEGIVTFSIIPTGGSVAAGADLTINCHLDSNPDIKASHGVSLSLTPGLETVDLVEGCNPVSSTWADGTDVADVAGAVSENLVSIWELADPATGTWAGFSPDVPATENDLTEVGFLDSLFICVSGAATVERPEVAAP